MSCRVQRSLSDITINKYAPFKPSLMSYKKFVEFLRGMYVPFSLLTLLPYVVVLVLTLNFSNYFAINPR